jgi:hypothetical protein
MEVSENCTFKRGNQIRLIIYSGNFLEQTAARRCEDFPTFRELTPSPSSMCAGGKPKLPAHSEDGDGVRYGNVGKPSHLKAAVCLRKCN